VHVSHARSSGPGGQNVNKVATKVHLRVDLAATTLPPDVRERLIALPSAQATRDESELILNCDETRSQAQSNSDASLAPSRP
jgi:ribosome-associated protein